MLLYSQTNKKKRLHRCPLIIFPFHSPQAVVVSLLQPVSLWWSQTQKTLPELCCSCQMPAVKFKGGRNGLQPLYNHKNLLMIQNFHLNNKKQNTDNREKKKKISMSLLYVS